MLVEIDLSWSASSDNVGIKTYVVYRDSERLATVVGTKTTYQDTAARSLDRVRLQRASHGRCQERLGAIERGQGHDAGPRRYGGAVDSDRPAGERGELQRDRPLVDTVVRQRGCHRLHRLPQQRAADDGPGDGIDIQEHVVGGVDGVRLHRSGDGRGRQPLRRSRNRTKAKTLASADTEAPSTPTTLTATAVSAAEIDLSWGASSDNVAVTGYIIYRDGTRLATVPGTETTYRDSDGRGVDRLQLHRPGDGLGGECLASCRTSPSTKTGSAPGPP